MMHVAVGIDWSSREPADGRTAEAADFSDAFRPLARALNTNPQRVPPLSDTLC